MQNLNLSRDQLHAPEYHFHRIRIERLKKQLFAAAVSAPSRNCVPSTPKKYKEKKGDGKKKEFTVPR